MTAIPPGAMVGIIGAGQLARMMALEARRMGYRIAVLGPERDGPGAQVADVQIAGALDDIEAAMALAAQCAVITLDTEHVPADLLAAVEQRTPVRPSPGVLRTVQDRIEQRRFLTAQDLPQPRHAFVTDTGSLRAAGEAVGFPAVLKTSRAGYDGKGQVKVERGDGLEEAWQSLGRAPAVLETFVDFACEVSIILARDLQGHVRFYPLAENTHRRHVLHTTRVPARVPAALVSEAESVGGRVAAALGHTGMMTVELFVTREGRLLVNEIAPRTHNSGHYTFGACATSQFEQHVRAVCGLPLGDTSLLRPAVMVNLLGDLWADGAPDWRPVFSRPTARLHLYGKEQPFPGRKMGHVLVVAGDVQEAAATADAVLSDLEAQVASKPGARPWT